MSIKDNLQSIAADTAETPKVKAKRTRKATPATSGKQAADTGLKILQAKVKYNGLSMSKGTYQGHEWVVCGTRKLAYQGLKHMGFSALTISALIVLGIASHSAKSGLKSTGKGTSQLSALKELCSTSMFSHWKKEGYLVPCPDGFKLSANGYNNLMSRLSKASDSYATNDAAVQAALQARLQRTAIEIDGQVMDFSTPVRVAMVK